MVSVRWHVIFLMDIPLPSPSRADIYDQSSTFPVALVAAVVCGVIVGLLFGWAILEATSRPRHRFAAWSRRKTGLDAEEEGYPDSTESILAVWSARDAHFPAAQISAEKQTSRSLSSQAKPAANGSMLGISPSHASKDRKGLISFFQERLRRPVKTPWQEPPLISLPISTGDDKGFLRENVGRSFKMPPRLALASTVDDWSIRSFIQEKVWTPIMPSRNASNLSTSPGSFKVDFSKLDILVPKMPPPVKSLPTAFNRAGLRQANGV